MEQFLYEHPVFTYQEFKKWKLSQGKITDNSLHMALLYYVKKGTILRVRRELYATVPPNSSPETLMVDPYLIAAKTSKDSVLAYHTALELHGVAYSSFEQFTFLTQHKVKSFEISGRWYQPVSCSSVLTKKKDCFFGVETINRQGVDISITNPARTFVDILDRIDLSGGIEELCRSIENMAVLDIDEVIEYCLMLENSRLASKVGYFLEQRTGAFSVTDKQLQRLLKAKPKSPQYISKDLQDNCHLVKKWNLMIPEYVAKKSWEETEIGF